MLRRVFILALALTGGCRTPPSVARSAVDAGPCVKSSQSNLPGVSIDFVDPSCRFTLAQAAAGIQIGYDVEVAQDLSGVVPLPQDDGHCGAPGSSGLIVFEQLDGNGQRYCLCDTGLCPAPLTTAVTLQAGSYPSTFSWKGRNWTGPSDTSNPMGAPFPAGSYLLHVSAHGLWRSPNGDQNFAVVATLGITLVP
jgi:hypothetical protein